MANNDVTSLRYIFGKMHFINDKIDYSQTKRLKSILIIA